MTTNSSILAWRVPWTVDLVGYSLWGSKESDILKQLSTAQHASLSFTNSQSLLKLMSIESVMSSNHLILCHPLFLLPSIFPSIRVFSNESVLLIKWPKYWNFSISPSNKYSRLIPLGWTGSISLQSKNSQESSSTPQFKRINSSVLSLLYGTNLISTHDYWTNHSIDYMGLCQQSNVSAF